MKSTLVSTARQLLLPFALLFCLPALADVSLPQLLGDGAVLQRGKPIHIWGWADKGEQVTVTLAGKTLKTKAKDGSWAVSFPAMSAGGPYKLTVQGKNKLERNDLLLGDVWIAAGQSNMELPLRRVKYQYPGLIENTRLPQIRAFGFPLNYEFKQPLSDYPSGDWKTATPENLAEFSAVGFFFARKLYEENKVPVGLIVIPVGGSPLEAWVSEATLKDYPQYLQKLAPFKDDAYVQQTIAHDKAANDAWYGSLSKADLGLAQHWEAPGFDDSQWQSFKVPGYAKTQGIDFGNGSIWLRKHITLSKPQLAQLNGDATLWLGAIVDGDQVYVNGQLVGQTGYMYPPRIYAVPAAMLKTGDNTIAIRITSYTNNAGLVLDKRYALDLGAAQIPLAGDWRYAIAANMGAMEPTTTLHYLPTSLYKARLAPAFNMGISGAIWYQGESNTDRAAEYARLFPAMVADWRKQFKQGDFPFLFVQLANFLAPQDQPGESNWAALREAQRQSLKVKNTAMAVTLDLGEWNDIHPQHKQEVGERLALGAMKLAYGHKDLLISGPRLDKVKTQGDKLVLHFNDVGTGLVAKGGELQQFAIAGADKKFVWATARLSKDTVTLSAPGVTKPVWVRYAWADNPAGANLYNSADLPASSFEASAH